MFPFLYTLYIIKCAVRFSVNSASFTLQRKYIYKKNFFLSFEKSFRYIENGCPSVDDFFFSIDFPFLSVYKAAQKVFRGHLIKFVRFRAL
jgi:hypothetical protein